MQHWKKIPNKKVQFSATGICYAYTTWCKKGSVKSNV